MSDQPMRKLARSMMRSWAMRHLKTVQGGLCPLCGKEIDMTIPKEGVIDHDHDTGEIRGILHRSCNAAEGKVSNAAARWGAKSSKYNDICDFLENLVKYLKQPGTGLIYPTHETPEQKAEKARAKARTRRAESRARQRIKEGV